MLQHPVVVKIDTQANKAFCLRRCLLENKVIRKEQFMIGAKRHQIYTIKKKNQIALNEDNKEELKRYHIRE
jgi:hypothetical protein